MALPPTFIRRLCTTASLSRAVRPIPLKLIRVAKGKDGTAFGDEWADKVRRYTQIEELQIKPNPMNTKDPKIAKQQEGERVLKSVRAGERLVVLDERGRDLKSENFAEILAQASDEGWPSVVFAIGGPYGHSSEVRERADDVIRLSSCVLNHSVARIVLLEQIYRGWTILRGEPYHH